jgi:hypothetical protein
LTRTGKGPGLGYYQLSLRDMRQNDRRSLRQFTHKYSPLIVGARVYRATDTEETAIAFLDQGPAEKRLVYERNFMVEWRRVQQRRPNTLMKYPQDRRTNGHLAPITGSN